MIEKFFFQIIFWEMKETYFQISYKEMYRV